MSATEELRRLLDERGVNWTSFRDRASVTVWMEPAGAVRADEYDGGLLLIERVMTPEQAIAATLGRGTCRKVRVHDSIEDEMHCSECGRFLGFAGDIGAPPYNYCPNCGRKVVEA